MQRYKDRSAIRNFTPDQLAWADTLLNDQFIKDWKQNTSAENSNMYKKYLDETDTFMSEKIAILNFLKLQDAPAKSIFDIGTGVGHFITLAKHFGHSVAGSDTPTSLEYLKDIHAHYKLPISELLIYKQEEFKLPSTYDLITTARVVFDFDENDNPSWSSADWKFLKENIFEYLNPNGQFFIKTNIKHVADPVAVDSIVDAYGERLSGWNSITYLFTKT